jgi:hypothetical protein
VIGLTALFRAALLVDCRNVARGGGGGGGGGVGSSLSTNKGTDVGVL